jgi:VWFA-related protein
MARIIQWTSLLLLVALALAALRAEEAPVVRVNTRLVEVDVVVHSKGEAVADLTQDDFTVLDNGKPQKIAVFNLRSSQSSRPAVAPLPQGTVSNRLTLRDQEQADATIVLFDTLNTAVGDQGYAREQLMKYLGTLKSGEHFALYNLAKTLRVVQDFTDDPDRIIRAAKRYGMESSGDQTADDLADDLLVNQQSTGDAIADAMYVSSVKEMQDAAQVSRAVITGKALELIARHLEGLPGRKTLVWLGSSFQAQTTDNRSHNGHETIEHKEFSREIDAAVRALNNANIAVYPIDPRDPYNAGLLAPGIDSMNLFASGTGGRAFYTITDLAGAMKTAVEDSEVVYALGFYPGDIKLDGSYHSLSVRVARKGVDLRNRKGYFATDLKQPTEKQSEVSLKDTFATPLEATGIGMTARLDPDEHQTGVYQLTMTFNLQELHLDREGNNWVALLRCATYFPASAKPNGTEEELKITLTEQRLRETLANGYTLKRAVIVGNRTGDLRVAIQDRVTGTSGSVKLSLAGLGQINPKNGQ